MFKVLQTVEFHDWHKSLRDLRARTVIARRIERITAGTLGDWRPVGADVSEMRIDIGSGYRLYFTRRKRTVIVLLVGGDKRTQDADIKRAARIAKTLEV